MDGILARNAWMATREPEKIFLPQIAGVVAAPLCWGVLRAGEHGSRLVLHRLGEGGVLWLQPAETFY